MKDLKEKLVFGLTVFILAGCATTGASWDFDPSANFYGQEAMIGMPQRKVLENHYESMMA